MLGFTPLTLLPVAVFELAFSAPGLMVETFAPGLSFAVIFCDVCSCLFFSTALLLSAMASAFSFSLVCFSSSFFFRSASSSLTLEDLGSAFDSPGAPGFLASPALLGPGLVYRPAEGGFFGSGLETKTEK